MKFIIQRSRGYDQPCEEARKEKAIIFYPWSKKGEEEEVWVVEVNTLEELINLFESIKKQIDPSYFNGIIISESLCKEIPYEIEVYDDWRE